MVYMAGDNGKVFSTAAGPVRLMAEMTTTGYKDIWKMGQVGSTDAVAVTCLFDTQHGSYLVEVRKGSGMANSVVKPLAPVNMGDPENLRVFVVQSVQNYPADITFVLWNHGMGWLDIDDRRVVRGGRRRELGLFSISDSSVQPPLAWPEARRRGRSRSMIKAKISSTPKTCDWRSCKGGGHTAPADLVGMDAAPDGDD